MESGSDHGRSVRLSNRFRRNDVKSHVAVSLAILTYECPPPRVRLVDSGLPSLILMRRETEKGSVNLNMRRTCSRLRFDVPGSSDML